MFPASHRYSFLIRLASISCTTAAFADTLSREEYHVVLSSGL